MWLSGNVISQRAGLVGLVVLLGLAHGCGGDSGGGDRSNRPLSAGAGGASGGAGSGGAGSGSFGSGPGQVPTALGGAGGSSGMGGGEAGSVSVSIDPLLIDECGADNPAQLDTSEVDTLKAGGGSAPRVLYPYDGTVFPRGMLAPLLMWDGMTPADAVYVHIKASLFEWHGCLTPTGPNLLALPEQVWEAAGQQTRGATDPFMLELTTLTSGMAAGPSSQSFVIAQATIKGSIYYNSYSSRLPGGLGVGGSVLRIPPGGTAEKFVSNECNGCHSVSANGSRLISQTLGTGGRSYLLAPDTQPDPPAMPGAARIAYAALYPDGSRYLVTYATPTVEVARANLTGLGGAPPATLFETDTAAPVAGTGIPEGAMMPSFSPDGTKLVFTDLALENAHGLGITDFNVANNTATGYRALYMESDMSLRPGWPFLLPDNAGVVFTRTSGLDFSGDGAGLLPIPIGPLSDLYLVDVDSGEHTMLARAMGFATPSDAASDVTYLPFGAEDLHKNYFPTISPVAAGGYFWLFFDSLRHYGNLGLQRQLWGAAITIAADGNYSVDRSHPAFYLPGQELGTGNHRAFAALDACVQDGTDCTSGIDCCGGFCFIPEELDEEFAIDPVGTCDPPPEKGCSRTDARCATDADCCPPEPGEASNSCIAGFCAYVPVLE